MHDVIVILCHHVMILFYDYTIIWLLGFLFITLYGIIHYIPDTPGRPPATADVRDATGSPRNVYGRPGNWLSDCVSNVPLYRFMS